MNAKNTVWFNEVNRTDLGLVGGKGGNLGEMIQAGLPIPDGYIVTSAAYYKFLDTTGIRDQMTALLAGLNPNDSVKLKEASEKIKTLIKNSAMPEEIKSDIEASYVQLCGADPEVYVAVRSSATAEDLPGASFAGQQATFLNVHGAQNVIGAVQRCWASLFEARAIFYRADKGFDHMKVGIAVPVQRMVQSEKSGIMFTVDPITNDRSKIIIEAGYGLGESVVSGSITPDRYIVDKATFEIVDKEINDQEFKIVKKPLSTGSAAAPTPQPATPVESAPVAQTPAPAPEPPAAAPEQSTAEPVAQPPAPAAEQAAAPVENTPVAQTPAPEVPAATTPETTQSSDADQQGDKFVISENDLKADLEAIRQSYAQSGKPADGDQKPDDDNQTVTSTRNLNMTLTYSGDPNSVDTPAADPLPPGAEPMVNDEGVVDAYNLKYKLSDEEKQTQKMTDEEIVALAKIGAQIEEHYQYPQDTEWGIENGQIYIVQARPVTTLGDDKPEGEQAAPSTDSGEAQTADGKTPTVILKGGGASVGAASGPVKIIHSPSEIDQILEGDILVTEMTTPDYVPAMKRAAAIITDTGGRTCHAAIVSRELGIPCVVGTKEATSLLKVGQIVTVNGTHGLVYEGEILEAKKAAAKSLEGAQVVASTPITATKVYVNLAEKDLASTVAAREVDGVGLLRAEFMIADIGVHPKKLIQEGRQEEFIEKLHAGLRMFAEPFHPRPVIYRATDFKSNEYRNLEGGADFEPHEENPMIGYRGCFRYIADPEVFALELEAIKRTREEFDNLHVMIPFVRTVEDMEEVKTIMEQNGLKRTKNFKLFMMVEIPSNVFLIDQFCKVGIDGISIGSNDLTQLILGVDRDSELVSSEFDERNEAVQMALEHVIRTAAKHGVVASICGQAPSVYPEITEKLVEWGINSVSVSPDMIDKTRRIIASVERKMLLKRLASVEEKEDTQIELLRR